MGKHTTYRGIDIDHYKMMRSSMSSEAFAKWVHTVTGKPRRGSEDPLLKVAEEKFADWEGLARKLQKALIAQLNENKDLERLVESHQKRIYELESKSWLSRLFNLKG